MGRNAIRSPLARDIEVCMRNLEERDGANFKTIGAAYDAIKKSNSSLARRKKRQLEDAIEEVLRFRKREEEEGDDSEAGIDDTPPAKPADDRFLLNRQMTKLWRDDPEPTTTAEVANATNGTEPLAKKRKIQQDEPKTKKDRENGTESAQAENIEKTKQKKVQKTPRYDVQNFAEGPRLGGIDQFLEELMEFVSRMTEDQTEGVFAEPKASGLLLSGPRGVGKRSLAQKLAATLDVPLIAIDKCLLDTERMAKSLSEAVDEALRLAPSFLFLEDLELHLPKSGGSGNAGETSKVMSELRDQLRRIKDQQDPFRPVLAIATTSAIGGVDPVALGHGLFRKTVHIRVPDLKARKEILEVLTDQRDLHESVDLQELAKRTHGFVAADLGDFTSDTYRWVEFNTMKKRRAALEHTSNSTLRDGSPIISDDLPSFTVRMEDFEHILTTFVPSLRQEGFTKIPSVTWDQVGALEEARQKLHTSIIGPIKDPEMYKGFGLSPSAGILLHGPPGCGKTLVAQAVANAAQASFILINGPELLNKYVGESERGVRDLFQRARSSTPCILFFDEIDSIAPRRNTGGTEASTRVVNTLLTELDGVGDRSGIFVIGTTNRPEMIDEAMLRPGRLNERLFLDLPTEAERVDILRAIYRTRHAGATDTEVSALEGIARDKRCRNFSGADLSGLHVAAAKHAVERHVMSAAQATGAAAAKKITEEDWEFALENTEASVPRPELYRSMSSSKRLE